jgi:superfamily II DNA helicase RecQ
MQVMKINPCKVHVFRAPTTCVNIAYSVFEHNLDKDKADTVCRLIQGKLAQYLAPAKIIVYGRTIERTTELSRALDCYEYYYKVGDYKEKEEIIEQWQHRDGRLIVATNVFGLGIDTLNIRVVIYIKAIYQIRNYSQESGQGRQDRQRSEAIVMIAAKKQVVLQKKQARARAQRQLWKIQSQIISA